MLDAFKAIKKPVTEEELQEVYKKVSSTIFAAGRAMEQDWIAKGKPSFYGAGEVLPDQLPFLCGAAAPHDPTLALWNVFPTISDEDIVATIVRELGFTLVMVQEANDNLGVMSRWSCSPNPTLYPPLYMGFTEGYWGAFENSKGSTVYQQHHDRAHFRWESMYATFRKTYPKYDDSLRHFIRQAVLHWSFVEHFGVTFLEGTQSWIIRLSHWYHGPRLDPFDCRMEVLQDRLTPLGNDPDDQLPGGKNVDSLDVYWIGKAIQFSGDKEAVEYAIEIADMSNAEKLENAKETLEPILEGVDPFTKNDIRIPAEWVEQPTPEWIDLSVYHKPQNEPVSLAHRVITWSMSNFIT